MTHESNQGPDDLNWMDIAREDAVNDVRHRSKRLPFLAAAISLAIIGGGAVFAQANNESAAQANNPSTVASTPTPVASADALAPSPSTDTTLPPAIPNVSPSTGTTLPPAIPNVSPSVGGPEYEDRDDDHGWFGDRKDHDRDDRGDGDGYGHRDDDD